MAIKPKDVYQGRRKAGKPGRIIAWTAAALFVLAIALFFGLRHFAVYDEYGNATVVLPFSQSAEK
ncbi:MAG: hypothetical protein GXY26_05415 [Clostridiales bacterium]|jgi:hypothetical protein|nr:hypothetical protein [Clostridiales bacterium]